MKLVFYRVTFCIAGLFSLLPGIAQVAAVQFTVVPVKNPRLDKINAMKDSVLKKLQPELAAMLDLLKSYVQNMLQEKPSKRLHRELDKKTMKKVKYAFTEITGLLYHAMALLTNEEKQAMQKKLKEPAGKDDFLNTFLNSFNAITENK